MPKTPDQTPGPRLAIDVGGTFTDTVLSSADGQLLASNKTLTTHANPADGALTGAVRALTAAGVEMSRISGVIHGTTLATNALLEKRGARVATVTTAGFRDILEIAYERRYSQYDIALEKPDLLVPRERAFTISERMSATGEPLLPLDQAAFPALLDAIDASEADALAVCLLHAYANPDHERRLRDWLEAARPDLAISLSSDVSPEAREFDRLCTTLANAYIQPLMAGYLAGFQSAFTELGLTCPILMMTAGGGMTTLDVAARFPIRLVESGPAGGAILAARIAEQAGLDHVLSFDMGGTTAKLCLIDGARPQTSRQFEIGRAERFIKGSGMPVRIPVIEMIEIGAGGGSIAAVDRLGRLTVGPQSAGSEPGPVAFGRGGAAPTVTDADVAQGYIEPRGFAEGQFRIDDDAARSAIATRIARPLAIDPLDAAEGISRIADENMASAARTHAVESGKDLAARTMIAFGGNGPLHACRVARGAGVRTVLVPANPSVGSAVGFLHAAVSFEIVRSHYTLLDGMDVIAISALLTDMGADATGLARQGAPDARLQIARSAYMRYRGQGHEIEIPLPSGALEPHPFAELRASFEHAYAQHFSRPVPGMEIEILNWAVRCSSDRPPTPAAPQLRPSQSRGRALTQSLRCDVTGQMVDATLVARDTLAHGDRVWGPALITEPQTTTFVGSDFAATVDKHGNLLLTREDRS